jgi:hypothetical protein
MKFFFRVRNKQTAAVQYFEVMSFKLSEGLVRIYWLQVDIVGLRKWIIVSYNLFIVLGGFTMQIEAFEKESRPKCHKLFPTLMVLYGRSC